MDCVGSQDEYLTLFDELKISKPCRIDTELTAPYYQALNDASTPGKQDELKALQQCVNQNRNQWALSNAEANRANDSAPSRAVRLQDVGNDLAMRLGQLEWKHMSQHDVSRVTVSYAYAKYHLSK